MVMGELYDVLGGPIWQCWGGYDPVFMCYPNGRFSLARTSFMHRALNNLAQGIVAHYAASATCTEDVVIINCNRGFYLNCQFTQGCRVPAHMPAFQGIELIRAGQGNWPWPLVEFFFA